MSNENHLPITPPDAIGDEGYEPGGADESFEEWAEKLSVERLQLSVDRALRKLGLDGIPSEADEEFQEFAVEATYQAALMYTEDTLRSLERKGYAEAVVLEDGSIGYPVTPAGRQALEDYEAGYDLIV